MKKLFTLVMLLQRLEDAEHELSKIQNLSQTLQEDLLHSRQKDQEAQSRLEQAEAEIRRLNQSLQETEKKAQVSLSFLKISLKFHRNMFAVCSNEFNLQTLGYMCYRSFTATDMYADLTGVIACIPSL